MIGADGKGLLYAAFPAPCEQAKAIIAAAPEMLALLRKNEWINAEGGRFCQNCWYPKSGGHAPDCALAALLARIDAAKESA